jgi:hypothetical protein
VYPGDLVTDVDLWLLLHSGAGGLISPGPSAYIMWVPLGLLIISRPKWASCSSLLIIILRWWPCDRFNLKCLTVPKAREEYCTIDKIVLNMYILFLQQSQRMYYNYI